MKGLLSMNGETSVVQAHTRMQCNYARKHQLIGFLFALPIIVFLLCFVLYPVIYNIWLSFTNASLIRKTTKFVGLQNYVQMFENKLFGKYLWNTVVWTFWSVLGQIVLGMAVALLVSHNMPGATMLRNFLLVPYVVPAVTLALVSKWVLNSDYGIISYWLQKSGFLAERQSLLAMQKTAMSVVVILNVWRSFPFTMLMYWAALKNIDPELYEAATVDGASGLQTFWYIKLPALQDTTLVLVVLRIIWTATYYDLIFMVTGGGPAGSTTTLPILIYQTSFGSYQIGYAAAISMVLGVLMFVCILIYIFKCGFKDKA
jgi:multiple sugar transport system permease protein